ncbi:MAG TPA: hypothetical protein VGH03_04505 [Caulobacteraceae bacterium]|jgi:hypothetical protein
MTTATMVSSIGSVVFHATTTIAYVLHVGGGVAAFSAGMVTLFARKGGRLHRTAGTVFFASMLVMAAFAAWLGVVLPDLVNLFIAVFVAYLVVTGWMTVHTKPGVIGRSEKIALIVAVFLCAPFAILSFQLAAGLPPLLKSTVPIKGPVLIAIYCFTGVLAIAAVSDARLALAGGISGARRIARHLWRMCLGLTLATGSAFTNGLPRLLPALKHAPDALLLFPQFLVLGVMAFWLFRVRLTPWLKQKHATLAYSG